MFVIDHKRVSMGFTIRHMGVVLGKIVVMMRHNLAIILRAPNPFAQYPGAPCQKA